MMSGWMMNNWGMGYGALGWLLMLLFWVLVIAGIVFLVRRLTDQRGERGSRTEETPLDVLKKRYARGEIDKEEFESRRRDLA